MEEYKKRLSLALSETGALFFDNGLVLKDGRPTPYFVNIGKFNTGRLLIELGSFFAEMLAEKSLLHKIDIIVGPSYKGSSIASGAAVAIFEHYGREILFDYDRKEAKVHGERSSSSSLFVNNTFFNKCKIFAVDDVITSMGTKLELVEKINKETQGLSGEIIGLGIVVDREQTTAVYNDEGKVMLNKKGLNPIEEFTSKTGIPFFSIAGIREIVEYLYANKVPLVISNKKRPMDESLKKEFDNYMDTYGRE